MRFGAPALVRRARPGPDRPGPREMRMGGGVGRARAVAAGRPKDRPAADLRLGLWPGQQKKWGEANARPTPGTKRAAKPAPLAGGLAIPG